MMNHYTSRMTFNRQPRKRGAFTLVEVLVALAVMMVMMTIILVPINMGMNLFHIGKARSEVQQANRLVINQLAAELKQAVFVFPNEEMRGVTNKAPYSSAPYLVADGSQPYYDTNYRNTATAKGVSNTARLDFLLPAVGTNGAILSPPVANNYIVTYYARRLDADLNKPYDIFSNPVVLWRAQYPYRNDSPSSTNTADLVDLGAGRYSEIANLSETKYDWLRQTKGEPNLYAYANVNNSAVLSTSHTQLTPRDMALVAPDAASGTSYQPDSSFIGDDTNNDGKIDRINISILLTKYDSIGAEGDKSQQIRSTQTVVLPNIR
jgi:type II secretory pathway pseudopilin PulG